MRGNSEESVVEAALQNVMDWNIYIYQGGDLTATII